MGRGGQREGRELWVWEAGEGPPRELMVVGMLLVGPPEEDIAAGVSAPKHCGATQWGPAAPQQPRAGRWCWGMQAMEVYGDVSCVVRWAQPITLQAPLLFPCSGLVILLATMAAQTLLPSSGHQERLGQRAS